MQIYSWNDILASISSPTPISFFKSGTGISVGSFDGLHLGHRKLISTLVEKCKSSGFIPGVVTFTRPLPSIKHADDYAGDISTLEERLELLESCGVQFAIVVDFDEEFAARSGSDFFDILIKACNLKIICEGVDFRCGYKGAFNKDSISSFCIEKSLDVAFVEPVYFDFNGKKERISSSIIRTLIQQKDFETAGAMLGRKLK